MSLQLFNCKDCGELTALGKDIKAEARFAAQLCPDCFRVQAQAERQPSTASLPALGDHLQAECANCGHALDHHMGPGNECAYELGNGDRYCDCDGFEPLPELAPDAHLESAYEDQASGDLFAQD